VHGYREGDRQIRANSPNDRVYYHATRSCTARVGLEILTRPPPPTAATEKPPAWEWELGRWVWRRRLRGPSRWTALHQERQILEVSRSTPELSCEIPFCNIAGACGLLCGAFSCLARLDYVMGGHTMKPDINGYRLYYTSSARNQPNANTNVLGPVGCGASQVQ